MKFRVLLPSIAVILALALALPPGAAAEIVGRITQVEGRVDLLKGGQLPATAAKVDDSLQPGDVIRTKSLSKAQLTFVDNSVLTISPESRLAIEEYMYDAAQGKRNAVLQLFQGMALAVVSKIFQKTEPDFILKTHTAVMGIRGTEVGIRLAPNSSTFMNFRGATRVANIFPEVGDLMFRKAQKVAFSFGKAWVDLFDMQGTVVHRGFPPVIPFEVTPGDQKLFMSQLLATLSNTSGKEPSGGTPPAGLAGTGDTAPGQNLQTQNNLLLTLNLITIPPTVPAPTPAPPTETFSIFQTYSGYRNLFIDPAAALQAVVEGYGWTGRTGIGEATAYFVAADNGTRTITTDNSFLGVLGSATVRVAGRMSGEVSGVKGQDLTGDMTFRGRQSDGTRFRFSGAITVHPDGSMGFVYSGRWKNSEGLVGQGQGTMTFSPGQFFSQTASGTLKAVVDGDNTAFLLDKGGLTGQRQGAYPGKFKASMAAMINSQMLEGLRGSETAEVTLKMKGVVVPGSAGSPASGVMDVKIKVDDFGLSTPKITGPVSIDPATGILIGSGTTVIASDNTTLGTVNALLIQVPKDSGLKTDSFAVTAGDGKFKQVPNESLTQATISSTRSLNGKLIGMNHGPISADFNLTSTVTNPGTQFPEETIRGRAAAKMIGVVAGTADGDKVGISKTILDLKGVTQGFAGLVTAQPGGQIEAMLKGNNPVSPGGAPATQVGTITVKPAVTF